MQKIPTKFFGNPVETKSELLYLYYQVFREWGKARCSGKYKGVVSMKQGNKNDEYSSWSITSLVRGIPGSFNAERGRRNTQTHADTHSHTPVHLSWPLHKKTMFNRGEWCPLRMIWGLLQNYDFYFAIPFCISEKCFSMINIFFLKNPCWNLVDDR